MQNELYHHGIKGQRWGIRRYQNPDGTLTEEGKRRMNPHKAVQRMSDTELKKVNNRLKMESEYMELRYKDTERGRRALNTALKVVGAVGIASVGVASVTVGKEALRTFGSELGSKMASSIHNRIESAIKTASDNVTNKMKDVAENAAKNAAKNTANMIKDSAKKIINGPLSESQRSEALSKATDIGKKAAERALRNNTITRQEAAEYANSVRKKTYEHLIRQMST